MTNPAPNPPPGGTRLRDPEQLNQAIRLTSRSIWILLTGLGLCVAGVVAWGFLGRLDFHAQGQGILMRNASEVVNVVARAGGTVSEIHVTPGTRVDAGAVLVSVRLDEVSEQLKQAKVTLDAQRAELDRRKAQSDSDIARRKADLEQSLVSLHADIDAADKNRTMLRQLYADYTTQLQKGLATREQVQGAYDRLNGVGVQIREMNDKLAAQKTQQIEFENTVAANIADLTMRVIDAEAHYRSLQLQHELGATIRSPVAGVVTEITTQINQPVIGQDKLLVVESGNAAQSLIVHAYLPIDQGKRVAVGMPAQVSPDSIEGAIYGAIRGTVASVSTLPMSRDGLLAVIGNPALVATMMEAGAPIEIKIELEADSKAPSGLRWTSSTSPPTPVTPGTTATSRIVVDRVSPVSLIIPILQTWTRS